MNAILIRFSNVHSVVLPFLMAAALACQVEAAPPAARAPIAASPLEEAAQAERQGQGELRQELLAKALQTSPDDPAVRWQNGFVRYGGRWVAADKIKPLASLLKAQDEYRKLRMASQPTLASQLDLADYCRKHSLPDQERVHLSAVLELQPDHTKARERLGQQFIDGAWRTKAEITAARLQAKQAAIVLKASSKELRQIKNQFESANKPSYVDVARQLIEMRGELDSVAVIPAWEVHLSSANSLGGLSVVKALAAMPEPEASLSLARHAVFAQWPEVRIAAAEALKERDEYSYFPPLLGMLRSPWLSTSQLLVQPGQPLVYRYTAFSDGADKRQLAVLEQVFFLKGDINSAASQARDAANRDRQFREAFLKQENEKIQALNATIGDFLREFTGEDEVKTPDDWWQWWNDHNAVHVEGSKPLEQTYAVGYSTYVGEKPPPTFTPVRPASSKPQVKKDCLAGGTPVWTDRGPVDVDRIRLGDIVLSQDPTTGELAYKPVLRTTMRAPEALIRIETANGIIRASGGHPFWVAGRGWVRAKELQPGMVLHGVTSISPVQKILEEEKPVRSFNLVVEGFHTYFAGTDRVLSHDNTVRVPVGQDIPGFLPPETAP
ncbi:MAG: polymorphic toxin-type HINT domain-containing protein [Pirellulales bacterium]